MGVETSTNQTHLRRRGDKLLTNRRAADSAFLKKQATLTFIV